MPLKLLGTILCLSLLTVAHGQKTEILASLNAGLFYFTGTSAAAYSPLIYSSQTKSGYTNNPYGSKPGFSYGFSGTIKRVTRSRFIVGFDLGYELLRSKIAINQLDFYLLGTGYVESPATGRTYLDEHFINLYPFFGYRLLNKGLTLDLTAGPEIGYCLSAKEDGKATSNGVSYKTSMDRTTIRLDPRPRFQVATAYKRYGAYLGYSIGLANYKDGYVGGVNECYARMLRFGLTYRLK